MDLFKRVLFVAAAGLAAGGVVDYGLERGAPGDALMPAILGAMVLVAAWTLFSLVFGRLSRGGAPAALKQAALPFAAVALPLLLFLPVAVYQAPNEGPRFELAGKYPQLLPLATQTYMVLAVSVALVVALLAWRFRVLRRGPVDAAAAHPLVVLGAVIVLWVAGAVFLDVAKAMHLNGAANVAMFTDALRHINSDQGPLYSTLFQADGASALGVHAYFVWFIVWPLFVVWPSPQWLLAISDVALGLAAIPVFLLARRHFSAGVSLLLAIAYLGGRLIIGSPAVGELTEERFLPLFFISAFYFWHEKRYLPFVIFSLLAVSVREDMGIVLALLGAYSLIRRRDLKWWLPVILFGAAWTVVTVKWLIPAMNPAGEAARLLVVYGSLGDSVQEIALNIVRHPGKLIDAALSTGPARLAFYVVWQSLGFGMPLLSAASIMGLTPLAELLLSANAYTDHINMPAAVATMFPALILGLARLDRFASGRGYTGAAAGTAVVILFCNLAMTHSWFSPSWYQERYNYDAAIEIMERLPPDASAYLPMSMTPRAEPGQRIYSYYQVPYEQEETGALMVEQEYVVIDLEILPFYERYYQGMVDLFNHVEGSGSFDLVFERDGLRLYRRVGEDEPEKAARPPVRS